MLSINSLQDSSRLPGADRVCQRVSMSRWLVDRKTGFIDSA